MFVQKTKKDAKWRWGRLQSDMKIQKGYEDIFKRKWKKLGRKKEKKSK